VFVDSPQTVLKVLARVSSGVSARNRKTAKETGEERFRSNRERSHFIQKQWEEYNNYAPQAMEDDEVPINRKDAWIVGSRF